MPTTPYAKLLASVNGGAPTSGGITAATGDIVQFSFESTQGWRSSSRLEISFPAGFSLPSGWSSETSGGHTVYYVLGNTTPPPITLGPWGKYMPRLLVNGGGGQLTDESTAISVPSTGGLKDLGHRETTQFGGTAEGWAHDQRANLRVIEAGLGGGSGLTDVTGTGAISVTTPSTGVRQVAVAAASGSVPGTMSAANFTKLAGIAAGAAALSSSTPQSVGTAGSAGSATDGSPADHVHALSYSTVQTVIGGASSALGLNGQRITSVADPSSAQDAATKAYVDATAAGIDWKASVRAATTATITLSGAQTIDGVSVIAGDRVLVKDQTTASQNGLYVAASGSWSRATDADTDAEVTGGLAVWVNEGTSNGDTGWVLTTNDTITVGSTALAFTQFSGLGQVTAGAGLTKSGSTISVGQNADASIVVNADDIQLKAAYQTLLDNATANATASTLVKRDGSAGATFARGTVTYLECGSSGTYATVGDFRGTEGSTGACRNTGSSANVWLWRQGETNQLTFGDKSQTLNLSTLSAAVFQYNNGGTETTFARLTQAAPSALLDFNIGADGLNWYESTGIRIAGRRLQNDGTTGTFTALDMTVYDVAGCTVTLPTDGGASNPAMFVFYNSSASPVPITPDTGEGIMGSTGTYNLPGLTSVMLVGTGFGNYLRFIAA